MSPTVSAKTRACSLLVAISLPSFMLGCARYTAPKATDKQIREAPAHRASAESVIDEICVGDAHSCALSHDGKVACWGSNGYYQASSDEVSQLDAPRWVSDFPKASRLRCGRYSTCIQTPEGAIECLGFQYHDEPRTLRAPQPVPRPVSGPLKIGFLQPARDFILSSAGGCAILKDHSVSCWSEEDPLEPFAIVGVDDAEAFAPGGLEAASVSVTRTRTPPTRIRFAGHDPDPSSPGFPFHVTVLPALAGAEALLFTEDGLVCAHRQGAITCVTDQDGAPSAERLKGAVPTELLATSWFLSCFREGAAVRCIEPNGSRSLAAGVPGTLSALALSDHHACALVQGRALCWGEAGNGQLGDGTRYLHGPEPVPGITDATSVLTAHGLVCVTRKSDKLYCWGRSENWGALADSRIAEIASPGPIAELSIGMDEMPCGRFGKTQWCWDMTAWVPRARFEGPPQPVAAFAHTPVVSISTDESCAVDRKGRVGCVNWVGYAAKPTDVFWTNGDFVEVASFGDVSDHRLACALKRDGHVACIHSGIDHQWGPVSWPRLEALEGVAKVRAGSYVPLGLSLAKRPTLGCALTRTGEVTCGGDPWMVRLGQSSNPSAAMPAVSDGPFPAAKVEGLPHATDIAVSGAFACATTLEGQVYCWGSNSTKGAPNGAPGARAKPVAIRWPPP